jgi:hypothetical protein
MYKTFKKILKKIILIIVSGFLLITISYLIIKQTSILKKPNKNFTKKKYIFLLSSKDILYALFPKDNVSLDYNEHNEHNEQRLSQTLINRYVILKEIKGDAPNNIKKILFGCTQQDMNLIFILMRNYNASCFSMYIGHKTINEKKEIINYFIKNKKQIYYQKDVTGEIVDNLYENTSNLNSVDLDKLYQNLYNIYIIYDSLDNLIEDKEFQEFINEYIYLILAEDNTEKK